MHNKLASLLQTESSVAAGYFISASTAYDPVTTAGDFTGAAPHQQNIMSMKIHFVKRIECVFDKIVLFI